MNTEPELAIGQVWRSDVGNHWHIVDISTDGNEITVDRVFPHNGGYVPDTQRHGYVWHRGMWAGNIFTEVAGMKWDENL